VVARRLVHVHCGGQHERKKARRTERYLRGRARFLGAECSGFFLVNFLAAVTRLNDTAVSDKEEIQTTRRQAEDGGGRDGADLRNKPGDSKVVTTSYNRAKLVT
jgi:hypothetical protein